jgi:hypothetical protein
MKRIEESLISRIMKFLGIGMLASVLCSCHSVENQAILDAGQRRMQNSRELSLGYTKNESSSNSSDAYNLRYRNIKDLGKMRWQLDLDLADAKNNVDAEERASGDFYKGSSEKTGFGAGFKAGDRQTEARLAGHYSWENARIYCNVYGGERNDATLSEGVRTDVENEYFGLNTCLKLKFDRKLSLSLGGNYNKSCIESVVTGLPYEYENLVDSDALSGYALLSRNAGKEGAWYLGVISSRIELSSSENATNNTNAIGGYLFRLNERASMMPRITLGSQNGGGLDIIIGPSISRISSLYAQLREVERTEGIESDAYKTLERQIEQTVQNAGTHTLSLSGQENSENESQTFDASYNYTLSKGSRIGLGARHIIIPVAGSEIKYTDIMLNGEIRWKNNSLILNVTYPVDENIEHNSSRSTIITARYALRF